MGFLDFLKKNRPATAQPIVAPPPLEEPPKPLPGPEPDKEVPVEQDPFSPIAAVIEPPSAPPAPLPLPEHDAWAPTPHDLPDFSEEDIAALERLEREKPTVIGIDLPSPVMPEPQLPAPPAKPSVEERPSLPEPVQPAAPALQAPALPDLPEPAEPDEFLAAEEYLSITDAIRQSRRALRRSDESLREALQRHDGMDTQYARAAADIASIEERLRSVDEALFGE